MEKKSVTILTLDSEDSGQTGGNREIPKHWPYVQCCSLDSATEELAWETGLGQPVTACDSL